MIRINLAPRGYPLDHRPEHVPYPGWVLALLMIVLAFGCSAEFFLAFTTLADAVFALDVDRPLVALRVRPVSFMACLALSGSVTLSLVILAKGAAHRMSKSAAILSEHFVNAASGLGLGMLALLVVLVLAGFRVLADPEADVSALATLITSPLFEYSVLITAAAICSGLVFEILARDRAHAWEAAWQRDRANSDRAEAAGHVPITGPALANDARVPLAAPTMGPPLANVVPAPLPGDVDGDRPFSGTTIHDDVVHRWPFGVLRTSGSGSKPVPTPSQPPPVRDVPLPENEVIDALRRGRVRARQLERRRRQAQEILLDWHRRRLMATIDAQLACDREKYLMARRLIGRWVKARGGES